MADELVVREWDDRGEFGYFDVAHRVEHNALARALKERDRQLAAMRELVEDMAFHLEAVMLLSPDCKRCRYLVARAKEALAPKREE